MLKNERLLLRARCSTPHMHAMSAESPGPTASGASAAAVPLSLDPSLDALRSPRASNHCDLCDLTCTSQESLARHIVAKQHRRRLCTAAVRAALTLPLAVTLATAPVAAGACPLLHSVIPSFSHVPTLQPSGAPVLIGRDSTVTAAPLPATSFLHIHTSAPEPKHSLHQDATLCCTVWCKRDSSLASQNAQASMQPCVWSIPS